MLKILHSKIEIVIQKHSNKTSAITIINIKYEANRKFQLNFEKPQATGKHFSISSIIARDLSRILRSYRWSWIEIGHFCQFQ